MAHMKNSTLCRLFVLETDGFSVNTFGAAFLSVMASSLLKFSLLYFCDYFCVVIFFGGWLPYIEIIIIFCLFPLCAYLHETIN